MTTVHLFFINNFKVFASSRSTKNLSIILEVYVSLMLLKKNCLNLLKIRISVTVKSSKVTKDKEIFDRKNYFSTFLKGYKLCVCRDITYYR